MHRRSVTVAALAAARAHGPTSAGGLFPADVDFLNVEITSFPDVMTARGARLR